MTALPLAETHDLWCAVCLEFRVQLPGHYLCPCCAPNPAPVYVPPPRMPLDRPISTTSGEA